MGMAYFERTQRRERARLEQERKSKKAIVVALATGLGLTYVIGSGIPDPKPHIKIASAESIEVKGGIPKDLDAKVLSERIYSELTIPGTKLLVAIGELDVTTENWKVPLFDRNGVPRGSKGWRGENVITLLNPASAWSWLVQRNTIRRVLVDPTEEFRTSLFLFSNPEYQNDEAPVLYVNYNKDTTHWLKGPVFTEAVVVEVKYLIGEAPKILGQRLDTGESIPIGLPINPRRYNYPR
jgi:hypothetical protein